MFRRLFLLALSALLILTGMPFVHAEEDFYGDEFLNDLVVENVPPTEPVVVEGEFIRVTAQYLSEEDLTRYTAELINNPTFEDGTALTIDDLLFSLYVYLDPDYPLFTYISALNSIPGCESYQKQVSAERLTDAAETMEAIHQAGENHVWLESDGWTSELQAAYWQLYNEYLTACEPEFVHCAQEIVDYCAPMLDMDTGDLFGRAHADVVADESLRVAYAMLQWGYASSVDNVLTARHSGKIWNLNSSAPSVQDFADELSLAYSGDLRTCWEIESAGDYSPMLLDPEAQFIELFLGDKKDSVPSISGIRVTGENTMEIDLTGIDMYSADVLFGMPVLSLEQLGNMDQWAPEDGLYGHPFGDLSFLGTEQDIPGLLSAAPDLLDSDHEILY